MAKRENIITDFDITIKKEELFRAMKCERDTPVYEEVLRIYKELGETIKEKITPRAVLSWGKIPKSLETEQIKSEDRVLYMALTLGLEITKLAEEYLAQENYLAVLLIHTMADLSLFAAAENLRPHILALCQEQRCGIKGIYPVTNRTTEAAIVAAYENTRAGELLNLTLTSGYMYQPEKSMSEIYLVSENCREYHIGHDCSKCENRTCSMRRNSSVEVTVQNEKEQRIINCKKGESLLSCMRRADCYIPALCGGNGTCGKCAVRVLRGFLRISDKDQKVFTKEQLQEGCRLACMAYPQEDVVITPVYEKEEQMEGVGGTMEPAAGKYSMDDLILGIDIGTTTIAMELYDCKNKQPVDRFLCLNTQRAYGADIISRIRSATEGKAPMLQKCIRRNLEEGIRKLLDQTTAEGQSIHQIVIAANTTMVHLLMGYPCNGLGGYPFRPYSTEMISTTADHLLGKKGVLEECPVCVFPGISAFVGGDIVADLLVSKMAESEEVNLLIDLGTNGEMALGNRNNILVTSAAAGPAFEGGNIIEGTGSVPGAICSVTIKEGKPEITTIRGEQPVGICGTGLVEAVSELLDAKLLDETGLLSETYEKTGYPLTSEGRRVSLYQEDIREYQLAKSAIRSAIETLFLRYGISMEEVSHVYLAGGFGHSLDIDKAIRTGLLPKEFQKKVICLGNGALQGAVALAVQEKKAVEQLQHIIEISEEITLSLDEDFNCLYMEHMSFPSRISDNLLL